MSMEEFGARSTPRRPRPTKMWKTWLTRAANRRK